MPSQSLNFSFAPLLASSQVTVGPLGTLALVPVYYIITHIRSHSH